MSVGIFNLLLYFQIQREVIDFIKMKAFFRNYDTIDYQDLEKIKDIEYVAVIEIPSLSLKKGMYAINSKKNTVEYGIQILQGSTMPDTGYGNLLLAAHSGSSRISYFKKIHLLKRNDWIYIYYRGIKYIYQVSDIVYEEKDGTISIIKKEQKHFLTLTTCDMYHQNQQLVVISELESQEEY